ncbi:hypothetical protein LINPERHAP1_LOCUS26667, partial [Linum perenne]
TSHSWRGAGFAGFVVYSLTHRVRSWSRHCLRGAGRRRTPSTWSRARRLSLWRMWSSYRASDYWTSYSCSSGRAQYA